MMMSPCAQLWAKGIIERSTAERKKNVLHGTPEAVAAFPLMSNEPRHYPCSYPVHQMHLCDLIQLHALRIRGQRCMSYMVGKTHLMGMISPLTGAPSIISYFARVSLSLFALLPEPVVSFRRISISMCFNFILTWRKGKGRYGQIKAV